MTRALAMSYGPGGPAEGVTHTPPAASGGPDTLGGVAGEAVEQQHLASVDHRGLHPLELADPWPGG